MWPRQPRFDSWCGHFDYAALKTARTHGPVLSRMHLDLLAAKDALAERSKAVAQGAIPKGRGFEPHRRHFDNVLLNPTPNSMNFHEPRSPMQCISMDLSIFNSMNFNEPRNPHVKEFLWTLLNKGALMIQRVCLLPAIASLAQLVRA